MYKCNNRMNAEAVHNYYLNKLIYHLKDIDEDLTNVNWILRDGIWFKNHEQQCQSLCDLVLVTYNKIGIPIELKGSISKRSKALSQITQGREFIEDVLHLPCDYGKIVIYGDNKYKYETKYFR
jgi:hypothetical protein